MADVEFEDNMNISYSSKKVSQEPTETHPKLVELMIRYKIVKTSNQAYYTLIALTMLCFIIAIVILIRNTTSIGSSADSLERIDPRLIESLNIKR